MLPQNLLFYQDRRLEATSPSERSSPKTPRNKRSNKTNHEFVNSPSEHNEFAWVTDRSLPQIGSQHRMTDRDLSACIDQLNTVKVYANERGEAVVRSGTSGNWMLCNVCPGRVEHVDFTFIWPYGPPHAKISLAGSWCSWCPMSMLYDSASECHKLRMSLPATHHEYKFVVDGKWYYDMSKPTIANGFENDFNNVIHLMK